MNKLIVCSKDPNLEIGKIYKGLARGPIGYGALPDQYHRVIAKATEQDWIDCNVAWGSDREWTEILAQINGPWYYYEIQTD